MITESAFVFPGVLAFLVAFVTTPLVVALATKAGLVDDPRTHKHPKVIHDYPVPRAGGIPIAIAVILAASFSLPFDKHLIGIVFGLSALAVLGVLDDKLDLNPYLRLGAQFLAATFPIAAGIGISFLTNPFGGTLDLSNPKIFFEFLGETKSIWVLADAFALLWIVALMNFLNMGAKGVDGQLPGVVGISAITIALLSLRYSADITQWPVITLASITAGAFIGFLPWNIYPQKIMPGFGGSNIAGYLLAILSILSTAKVGTLIVALGIPLIDTGYTIVRRILEGKSPVWGDRGHLHHRLLDAGLSKRQVALFYWIGTLILGVLALQLNSQYKFYTIIGTGILVGGLILWLTYQTKDKIRPY